MLLPLILAAALLLHDALPAEKTIVDDVNARRQAFAMSPLHVDAQLTALAHERAQDMIRRHYFDHTNPDGMTAIDTLRARAYRFSYAGENISVASSEEQAEQGLWASPPHRENILGAHYRRVGIAIVVAASDCYVVQIFSD